jgi:hypothetical protein
MNAPILPWSSTSELKAQLETLGLIAPRQDERGD